MTGTQLRDAVHRGEVEKVLRHFLYCEEEIRLLRTESLKAAQQVEALTRSLKDAQDACNSLTGERDAAESRLREVTQERDQRLERAILAVKGQFLFDEPDNDGDKGYQQAVRDCVAALEALRDTHTEPSI